MKTIKLVLFAATFFFGTVAFGQNIITSSEVNVTINAETSREQLFQLRNELLAVGMDFQYTPQFDQNRKLISIAYAVRSTSGNITFVDVPSPVGVISGTQFRLVKQGDTWKKK